MKTLSSVAHILPLTGGKYEENEVKILNYVHYITLQTIHGLSDSVPVHRTHGCY